MLLLLITLCICFFFCLCADVLKYGVYMTIIEKYSGFPLTFTFFFLRRTHHFVQKKKKKKEKCITSNGCDG